MSEFICMSSSGVVGATDTSLASSTQLLCSLHCRHDGRPHRLRSDWRRWKMEWTIKHPIHGSSCEKITTAQCSLPFLLPVFLFPFPSSLPFNSFPFPSFSLPFLSPLSFPLPKIQPRGSLKFTSYEL